jgi:hypothetical protein
MILSFDEQPQGGFIFDYVKQGVDTKVKIFEKKPNFIIYFEVSLMSVETMVKIYLFIEKKSVFCSIKT